MMLLHFFLQACNMQTWKEYKSPADVNTWTCLDMYTRLERTLGYKLKSWVPGMPGQHHL